MLLCKIHFAQGFETFVLAEFIFIIKKLEHIKNLFHLNEGIFVWNSARGWGIHALFFSKLF